MKNLINNMVFWIVLILFMIAITLGMKEFKKESKNPQMEEVIVEIDREAIIKRQERIEQKERAIEVDRKLKKEVFNVDDLYGLETMIESKDENWGMRIDYYLSTIRNEAIYLNDIRMQNGGLVSDLRENIIKITTFKPTDFIDLEKAKTLYSKMLNELFEVVHKEKYSISFTETPDNLTGDNFLELWNKGRLVEMTTYVDFYERTPSEKYIEHLEDKILKIHKAICSKYLEQIVDLLTDEKKNDLLYLYYFIN